MAIDQQGLNNLLSMLRPKSNLDALKERREGLWKKLNQAADEKENGSDGEKVDVKQVIVDLQSTDKQIQQAVYDEEYKKLEEARLKREAEQAKSMREKEKALAKHESVLVNASMTKLLSAAGKVSLSQPLSNGVRISLSDPNSKELLQDHSPNSFMGNNDAINRDLREAAEYGSAAAEVARRRKNTEMKARIEEAALKRQAAAKLAAQKKKKAANSINVTV